MTARDDATTWRSAIDNLRRGFEARPHLTHLPYGWPAPASAGHPPLVNEDSVPGYVLVAEAVLDGRPLLTVLPDRIVLAWWDAAQRHLAAQPRDGGVGDDDLVEAAVETMCAEVMEDANAEAGGGPADGRAR